ncbi:L-ornithine N(5)-monooxygenase [Lecanosticta acicola]|uniref:L-ornithine N(5)-monooxygenase [NAD(P)H] n=1 Tax=Lecanosticta acicola TaxID=111012 RepID=A0AAI8YWZ4_9PEZI|nr:L-ornithine N(5)-monooxygenase [Lecanosticta acicola]
MSLNIEQQPHAPAKHRSFEGWQNEGGHTLAYDLVGVGFGTTALPLAASLADGNADARVLFVEQEAQFDWHPAHILPDNSVAVSFLRDLTTTQNPRSKFTFVNYLQKTNQLIRFTNNSKIAPSRRAMADYFRWAAGQIQQLGWVKYDQEVVQVRPLKGNGRDSIAQWSIEMQHTKNKARTTVLAKRVVLATGATPRIPQALSGAPLIWHSSSSNRLVDSLATAQQPLNIAVIGADQEAAELFLHLSHSRGKHTATMYYADSALRPEDDVAKVQDMLERPESLPRQLPPEVRYRLQESASSSPKINVHTLGSLYEAQYTQKIKEADSRKWRFQLKALSEVVGTEREQEKVRLVIRNPRTGELATSAEAFDAVVAATGYSFAINRDLIDIPAGLLDDSAIGVNREYQVNFRREALEAGCGMWLLGSLEDDKGRCDNFSWMSERAQRAARSILKEMKSDAKNQSQRSSERAMF